ncbi:penicillin-binding protein A [Oxobacter pfennigii]|uniref:Penicillin-binding protein A n=1 Tax=Oxobacter pfennigii TaxID=36849 RepID=A0A0N8NSZ8_9CLOT|nr:penicillin-binding transpeptidase domain-containing protein [Oxobacter pfennigii]KPU43432.1 penicillin-binding protein A [Oxobacter pfennigii]
MDDDKIRKKIIKVLIAFSFAFLLLIGYLSYFEIVDGESILTSQYNRRNRDRENDVLRGSIYDRDMTLIADSVRAEDGTQKRAYRKGFEYPYAPVIGYYSSVYGTSGIERYYANELLDAGILNPIRFIRDIMSKGDRKGNGLLLTIDSDLQKKAYDALGNNRGAVIAMDPKTGEVLCMTSKPVFNPLTIDKDWDIISKETEQGYFLNRALQPGLYPPGSTFKTVVAGKALETIDDIESKIYICEGNYRFDNYLLSDFNNNKHGEINIHDALAYSCNVTFGQIGVELGFDDMKSGAEDFGFNKRIDFDLPVAVSKYPDIDRTREDSLAQSAIGQFEVTATPFQMMLVAAAYANEGVVMKPFLVKAIADPYGWILNTTKPSVLLKPIEKETAEKVKAMMIDVVKKGTGQSAKISGIEVAGKTGTAEVGPNQPAHSWFIAFAPADDPKIALAVIVENGESGGIKAASVAREVIREYLAK